MMIYAIEYCSSDGKSRFLFFESATDRDFFVVSYRGANLIRCRTFKEVDFNEPDIEND